MTNPFKELQKNHYGAILADPPSSDGYECDRCQRSVEVEPVQYGGIEIWACAECRDWYAEAPTLTGFER